MAKDVKIVGANPLVRLFDDGEVTVAAAVWIVDWSVKGRGVAVVLWHDDQVRILGPDTDLSTWLATDFTRHFPEFKDLSWQDPSVEVIPVDVQLNLSAGMTVIAGDVLIKTSNTLDYRQFSTDSFDLDGEKYGLTMVIAPQDDASVMVAGRDVPGEPSKNDDDEAPSSSAYLTAAEVWTH